MEKLQELLTALTIEEKAALLEGVESWNTNSIPRLDIPALLLTDGPHGLRKVRTASSGFALSDNEQSAAFPTSATVASSWNPDNACLMGEAIANECAASSVDVLLAPGVNIKRSPLCGRNFEYYSEDPYLSGVFGSSFVKGVQSRGIGCSVKHYAANSNEDYRFVGDSVADERALREIYLRAFEMVVKEAQPYTVMCSYNRLNGVLASQNKLLLTDILRDEWGFDGLVMTDWGATCDHVAGIIAGCELDMPGGVRHNRKAVIDAVENGALSMGILDRAVTRVLNLIEKCSAKKTAVGFNPEESAGLSCEIAKDSAVLLKNDGTLPLAGNENLLVVGEMFEKMRFQGAGSSLINPPKVITPKDAFDKRNISYTYEEGFRCFYPQRDPILEQSAIDKAKQADLILFFGGITDFEESEGFDRKHMRLGENQTALLDALFKTGKKVVLVLYSGAPVELPYDELAAVLDMYLPGMYGGEATAALLYGEANPSGKLTESWPICVEDTSCYDDFDHSPISLYYESIYVGYRFYDKAATKLRFPFGYGMSYTSFQYDDMVVSEKSESVIVNANISNTGNRDGAEVVQLYVKNAKGMVFKAEKELRAFTKIFLKAGETKTVTMMFKKSDLSYWNVKRHDWVLENGEYEICLAASARDIRLTVPLVITDKADEASPYSDVVLAEYAVPPMEIPPHFAELLGCQIPKAPPRKPITLESPLRDLKQTLIGKIFYKGVMLVIGRDYKRAQKMPDSLERDTRLKNTYFLVKMMPSNSIRSMSMSSNDIFPYHIAVGCVEMVNGHIIRGLKSMLNKEKVLPLHVI